MVFFDNFFTEWHEEHNYSTNFSKRVLFCLCLLSDGIKHRENENAKD